MKRPGWPSEIKELHPPPAFQQQVPSACSWWLQPFVCPSGYSANPFKRDQKQWAQKKSDVLLWISLPRCTHFLEWKMIPLHPPSVPLPTSSLPASAAKANCQQGRFNQQSLEKKAELKSAHCACLARPGQLRRRVLVLLCSASFWGGWNHRSVGQMKPWPMPTQLAWSCLPGLI